MELFISGVCSENWKQGRIGAGVRIELEMELELELKLNRIGIRIETE